MSKLSKVEKALSIEYFWIWAIPAAMVLQWIGPNRVTNFEMCLNWFLMLLWWAAFPPLLLKKIKTQWVKIASYIPYWLVMGVLAVQLYTRFIEG